MSEEIKPEDNSPIILTKDQEIRLLEFWNGRAGQDPPTLPELVESVFPGKEPRDKWGKAVRKFLSQRKIKAGVYVKKDKIEFTEEQRDLITRNAAVKGAFEIAKEIFGEDIEPASIQVRSVAAILKTIPSNIAVLGRMGPASEPYEPPQTLAALVKKVNEYANPEKRLSTDNLTPKERKGLNVCLGYVNNKRLVYQMNAYVTSDERVLCESTFIKYVYDKPDLTQEEVDQFILIATEAVISYNALRTASTLQAEQENLISNGERMSMSLIDSITDARKYYDDSVSRQQKLYAALTQKRSERMSKQLKDNATILNLVNFVKEQESRRKLVEYNKMKEEKLRDEVKKYIDMSELKARFLGIGVEEIVNG